MRKDASAQHRRQVADIIGRASQLIRMRGWCVGALFDDSGRVCLMGAVREAAKGSTRSLVYDCYDEVNSVLRRPNRDIAAWSDEQTDGAKVADLLEGIAKKLDPRWEALTICKHGVLFNRHCSECYQERGY